MNKRERRFTNQPVSVEGTDKPVIRGYASVFNSPSNNMGFIELVDPHAFDSTLDADVRGLWNHNADTVLGRTKSGTLRLSVDTKGLKYEIDPPDTQAARDLITSMKRGDVDSSSFGFVTLDDKWDYSTSPATRTLLKVELFDVSPVTYPAYDAATSEARNFPDGMPESVVRALQHTKKVDGDNLTADCFLYVGDPNKTETWSMPWKFSDEEKTKSHLRDALARFDQDTTIPADDKQKVWDKLVSLCKEHGIQVSDTDKPRSTATVTEKRDDTSDAVAEASEDDDAMDDDEDDCDCDCAQCLAGACTLCSNDMCEDDSCACQEIREAIRLAVELANEVYKAK